MDAANEPNNLFTLRRRAGLTRAQLAQAACISRQTLLRLEAGLQRPRLDVAARLAGAVQAPLERVFPAATTPLALLQRRKLPLGAAYQNAELGDAFHAAGFDMEPAYWFWAYRLRGGTEGKLAIDGATRRTLLSLLQGPDECIVAFDAGSRRYAVKRDHLLYWHFLFEPIWAEPPDAPDSADGKVVVHFADGARKHFGADPDRAALDKAIEGGLADQEACQFQCLIYDVTCGESAETLSFIDEDGETVFLRSGDVAMISVPLAFVEPTLLAFEEDDDEPEAEPEDEVAEGEVAEDEAGEDEVGEDEVAEGAARDASDTRAADRGAHGHARRGHARRGHARRGQAVEEKAAEDAMAENAMAEDTMAKDTVAEDMGAEDTVAEDTVAEDTVVEDMGAEDMAAAGGRGRGGRGKARVGARGGGESRGSGPSDGGRR